MFEKTFLRSMYRTNWTIIGLFFRGLGFPINWVLSIPFTRRSMPILSFIKNQQPSRRWPRPFLLIRELMYSSLSILPFRILISSFKLFIISCFFFLPFSKSSNCRTFVELIPLVQQVVISATFACSFLKVTNISEISFVLLKYFIIIGFICIVSFWTSLSNLFPFLFWVWLSSEISLLWRFIEILWNVIHNFVVWM